MGSGNGYWTYMLRRLEQGKKKLEVIPVDSGMSEWRTMWVPDTVEADGVKWLKQNNGGKDDVLLLVYPNTGEDFTSKMIKAYSEYQLNPERSNTLADLAHSRHYDHQRWISELVWLHWIRQGDDCRLDGPRTSGLGEGASNSHTKLCR